MSYEPLPTGIWSWLRWVCRPLGWGTACGWSWRRLKARLRYRFCPRVERRNREIRDGRKVHVETRRLAALRRRPQARPAVEAARGLPGRNNPCPCGSGRKFKRCHGSRRRPRAKVTE